MMAFRADYSHTAKKGDLIFFIALRTLEYTIVMKKKTSIIV